MGVVYHTKPKCGCLAEVAFPHLLFICHVPLEDDQSGEVLHGKVKVVITAGLDEVKKGHRVTDFNILLLNESPNYQLLHDFTDCFEKEQGFNACLPRQHTSRTTTGDKFSLN